MSKRRAVVMGLVFGAGVLSASGCSSSPQSCLECPSNAGGAFGAGAPGSGGAVPGGGGVLAQGGAAGSPGGAPGAGGAPSTPAGQLMCGGKLCHAGGHCAADGTCPAFLGTCFSTVDNFVSCDDYCTKMGFTCAAQSCNSDGSPAMTGYSWVSFAAANRAQCQQNGYPDKNSFDPCLNLIWLSPTKPKDDVIRCCCKG